MGHKVELPAVPSGAKLKSKGSIGNPKRGLWCPNSNAPVEAGGVDMDGNELRVQCPECSKNLKALVVTQKKTGGEQTRYPYHYQSRKA